LNALVSKACSLDLIAANDINDRGEIAGQALVRGTTRAPAFLASRNREDDSGFAAASQIQTSAVMLPASVRARMRIQFVGAVP